MNLLQDDNILVRISHFDAFLILTLGVVCIGLFLNYDPPHKDLKVIGKRKWDVGGLYATYRFFFASQRVLSEGFQKDFFGTYPGFEAFNIHRTIFGDAVNKRLTPAMATLTKPLAQDSARMIGSVLVPTQEWKHSKIIEDITKIVSHVSSKVMLLDDSLGQVEKWHDLSVKYGKTANIVIVQLKLTPALLRPIVYWLLPSSYRLRKIVQKACDIVELELENANPQGTGKETPVSTLQWMKEVAERKNEAFNLAHGQLSMGVAAVLPMSNLVVNTLYDVTGTPGCIEPLQREIITALSHGGWDKRALDQMKLLDSAVKESLRLRSIQQSNIYPDPPIVNC
ncbi:hypothetical protein FE257_013064 [Aspergillus nanangensis]|uniref:Cytochrome P450 n=1 Tax=Aspergillus nanangensis TaxID=2582783 RepID=A0AAD4GQ94_ASPNN|nr:hypothetical protein FE257_013064 [Aspergillus nanangensis]